MSTLQSYRQDLHSNQLDSSSNRLVCTTINDDLVRTHPSFIDHDALTSNVSTQSSFTNEHSTTRMKCTHITPTSAFAGVNAPALDVLSRINHVKDESTDKLSCCMPDVKIKKTFSLLVCNCTKLKLDLTFVPSMPKHEHKKLWIKIDPMNDVFCKKKHRN